MGTLVLTTVGTIIGGPIGGAVGALIGNTVDQRLFGTRRKGPRLGDLTVQTSSYGQAIPKVFGRIRVAGTVIWATDIREDRHKSGGGKGQPKATSYSYSVSFAVALSCRRIAAVRRIWADGKLLRGAGGDWKSELGAFRLHLGEEDQAVDPLIAAAEGVSETPAYRDFGYAVFEDLQLADFGNRIPSLTFEVEADAGPVTIGAVAEAIAPGAVTGETLAAVAGYAATGDSQRAAVETLVDAFGLGVSEEAGRLRLSDSEPAPLEITRSALGASTEGRTPMVERERQAGNSAPDEVAIAYLDPARDWQEGLQRARWAGGPRRAAQTTELPAALGAATAKSLAQRRLAMLQAGRETLLLRLPWRNMDLRPGAALIVDGQPGRWRVTDLTLAGMVAECRARRLPGSSEAAGAVASPGRPSAAADIAHGATAVAALDLPALDDLPLAAPRLWVAAGGGAGWRRAALLMSTDGGTSWQPIGGTAAPATIGTALTTLGPATAALSDRFNTVDVQLLSADDWLSPCTDAALLAGANLALIGDELIQFGEVVALGGGRFRLGRMLRGRRGTEGAIAAHAAGERFVLIERDHLLPIDLPASAIGATLRVMASGPGDAEPALAQAAIVGSAVRPPAPVYLRAERSSSGDLLIGWVRRSRTGFAWTDGGDAPLGEERERYRVAISDAGGDALRTFETAAPSATYLAAEQAADGVEPGEPITVRVVQLGTLAASDHARIDITG